MVHRFMQYRIGIVGIYCSSFGGQSAYVTTSLFAACGTLVLLPHKEGFD